MSPWSNLWPIRTRLERFAAPLLRFTGAFLVMLLGASASRATVIPRVSLDEMVTRSEAIVFGSVTRSWAAWDRNHQFLWTHTEIAVRDTIKGNRLDKTVVSEPGGELNGVGMRIIGSPVYLPGEQVLLLLERMPNGFLRSAGFGQGRFTITPEGRVRVNHSGAELVRTRVERGSSVETLEGASLPEVRLRLARLVAARKGAQ